VRVLVVHAHPVAESFGAGIRDRAVSALRASGHDVDVLDLWEEEFEPALSLAERRGHLDPPESKPQLARHFVPLRRADAIVLVYPTWWGGPPAMLKGWFDRVWANGVAFRLPSGRSTITGTLRNVRRIMVLTTHGSGKLVNVMEAEPGKVMIRRTLRLMCHPLTRFRWVAMYGVDTASDDARARYLDRVDRAVRRI
jgi:putative NADPH-quinone reductase